MILKLSSILNERVFVLNLIFIFILVGCNSDDNGGGSLQPILPNKIFEISADLIKSRTDFTESKSYFEYDVSVHKITYSIDYKGETIILSGVVAIPIGLNSPALLIDNHGTLQRDAFAPSNAADNGFVYRFLALASAGYITFAPDYVGFGESINVFHPWLLSDPGADAVIGILTEGKSFLDRNNYPYDNRIFMTGFSEGGNITLAAQRKIEEQGTLNLVASSPVSGVYDLNFTFTNRLLGEEPTQAFAAAYMILALHDFYDWNEPLTDFFKEPYAAELQELLSRTGAFEDHFFAENLLSLDLVNGVLNHENLYNQDFLSDYETNDNNKVKQRLVENSTYMWRPVTPTMLHYGKTDFTSFFENSLIAHEEFINRGADPEAVNIIGYDNKDHEGSEAPAMKTTLEWFNTLK